MIRKIISIDAGRCNGCGLCVNACHEQALEIRDGKAVLIRDDYCDGLGDCLPACPQDALSFAEREALPYDEEAVKANLARQGLSLPTAGCPSAAGLDLKPLPMNPASLAEGPRQTGASCLTQWPVKIRLVQPDAACFADADLLVAADCTAFALAAFHQGFMDGKTTIIGCPKLDPVDHTEKLREIIARNDIRSVTVARMSVPCCGGLERAVRTALEQSGKSLPLRVATIDPRGNVSG